MRWPFFNIFLDIHCCNITIQIVNIIPTQWFGDRWPTAVQKGFNGSDFKLHDHSANEVVIQQRKTFFYLWRR